MPSIKAKDLFFAGGEVLTRRRELFKTIGKLSLRVWKVERREEHFYMIVNETSLEKFNCEGATQEFLIQGFELSLPPETRSLRTVVLRDIDLIYRDLTEDEIKQGVETRSPGMIIEEVIKLPGAPQGMSPLIKIRFSKIYMAREALSEGIRFMDQTLLPKSVEKEVYVRAIPCNNCLSFSHHRRECQPTQQMICQRCAGPGHKAPNCNAINPKCAHCQEAHETFSPQCQEKKKYIKSQMQVGRRRERDMAKERHKNHLDRERQDMRINKKAINNNLQTLPMNAMTVIMSAIVAATYVESNKPGKFEETYTNICKYNQIPTVRWPPSVVRELIDIGKEEESNQIPSQGSTEATPDLDGGTWNIRGHTYLSELEFDFDSSQRTSMVTTDQETDLRVTDSQTEPEESTKQKKKHKKKCHKRGREGTTGSSVGLQADAQPPKEKATRKNEPVGAAAPCWPAPQPSRASLNAPTAEEQEKERVHAENERIRRLGLTINYPNYWGKETEMNKGRMVEELKKGGLYLTYQSKDSHSHIQNLLVERYAKGNLKSSDVQLKGVSPNKMHDSLIKLGLAKPEDWD